MQTRRRSLFTTIGTEGAILPPDLLQRVSEGDADVQGLSPEDYHLASGERLGEAITRSWNRLVGGWAGFRDATESVPQDEPGTSVTRERWLLLLFQELGYGRLQTEKAVELDGRSYPVSHAWGNSPIHLVGLRVSLDRRSPGVAGAATQSPHGLVQELLNRSDERLWAFLSNGLLLRILRDNSSLTRQAYVEFDLEAMMEGEVYSDFVLLWLVCHQSRVEGERPEECWLERWSRLADEQGTRALEGLRQGVEEAITALGQGFLAHSANRELKDALRSGALSKDDYYRELLRLVYRLLFLFVAEDRALLLAPDADPRARETYERHYSTRRLRGLAERRRGTRHGDLWRGLGLVMETLGEDDGCPDLGLPALGSFLWSREALTHLGGAELANADLLEAVRALSVLEDRGARRAVDYKNLGSEELGSVYESLLELHPELNVDAAHFALTTAAGHERKTTGSYYTPSSLVSCLLDSALDPVLDEAASSGDPERAILELKVCDPASGSGHFLVAAAHRIARRLASVRTGDEEPAPEAVRTALRDVVGHCLYGVDVNPMAIELCKVSLWMEALEPGKPLSFLDAHIRSGNSLLGTTPELLAAGIPDGAFKVIEGDEKKIASELRKRNKQEREGQLTLEDEVVELEATLAAEAAEVEAADDDTLPAVRGKAKLFAGFEKSEEYRGAKLLADTWCAAFVQRKTTDASANITQGVLRRLARDPAAVPSDLLREAERLSEEYHFFHWHVEFSHVYAGPKGGFDCVLANPPWEHAELKEKEFFSATAPEIAAAERAAVRKRMINELAATQPTLFSAYQAALRRIDAERHFLGASDAFPLCGRGRINTYAVFAELMRSLVSATGRAGAIVPSGIATDDTTKYFFESAVRDRALVSLFEFENKGFFEIGHGHMNRFCLLTMTGHKVRSDVVRFLFRGTRIDELHDPERVFELTADDIALLNPNTHTCPVFRTRRDAELTKAIYQRMPVLHNEAGESGNPWALWFKQGLFNGTTDSNLFGTRRELEEAGCRLDGNTFTTASESYLPLYEAKIIHQFDHRYGDYALLPAGARAHVLPDVPLERKVDPNYVPLGRFWVAEDAVLARYHDRWGRGWFLGWRDVTDSRASARTVIASALPGVAVEGGLLLAFSDGVSPAHLGALLACWNSFVFDFVARQKVGGIHLKFFHMRQLPVPPPHVFSALAQWSGEDSLERWLRDRVLELAFTAWDIEPFAHDLRYDGPPFQWDPERRFVLRCELDAAFFHLYGLDRDDVAYVMDTFPIVRRREEQAHGEYRTKRVILEIYDELAEAIATGRSYQTRLDPPPADPRVAHPRRVPAKASSSR